MVGFVCFGLIDFLVMCVCVCDTCSLKRLHLYGNSSVTSSALESLASKCKYISDLNVGQCCQVRMLNSVSIFARK